MTRRRKRPAQDPPSTAGAKPRVRRGPDPVDGLIAAFAVTLVIVAFAFHPIGDYFTESDFYGAYASGARALGHGAIDWSRYGVYGPVYEMVLGALTLATRDPFVAARLISAVSAIAILAAVAALARRRWGAVAAFWLVVLVASNPSFFRYGYSASTDMLAGALWTVAAVALLASHRPVVAVTAAPRRRWRP